MIMAAWVPALPCGRGGRRRGHARVCPMPVSRLGPWPSPRAGPAATGLRVAGGSPLFTRERTGRLLFV